jgi:hypothetical protein
MHPAYSLFLSRKERQRLFVYSSEEDAFADDKINLVCLEREESLQND